jgi:type II secretion system protein J
MIERTTKRKAFTLLEIIIALSMVALILGGAYGTYTATTRSIGHSKPRNALQQQARIFLQRIGSEIRCCYAGYKDESLQPSIKTDPTMDKHIQLEDASLFKGGEVSSGRSFLRFVTSAVASKREQAIGGLAIVEYMLDNSTNTLSRSERRYIDGFEADKNDYNWIVALENIRAIKVEYYDGKEWLKEWNSNDMKKTLPKAVRMLLVIQSKDVGSLSFTSTAKITCREHQSAGIVKTAVESSEVLKNISNSQKLDD